MYTPEADRPPFQVIFGAGRQAAHVLSLAEWMGLDPSGLVLFDDAFPSLRVGPRDLPVAGRLDEGIDRCAAKGLTAIVALGSKTAARRYATYLAAKSRGIELGRLIHPSAQVAPTATIHENVVVMPGCVIGFRASLGALCCLFAGVTLEHDVRVEEDVVFGPGVVASGDVRVGRHAFLGAGAVCAPGVSIGERALIGAGATVVSDIPTGVIAIGVPARVVRPVPPGYDAPTAEALRELGCEP